MAESDGGSGSWLMTYADFITLMMIFFIVLYTFTPGVEKDKFAAIIGAFQGKDGVLEYESVFSDEMLKIEVQRAKNWDELEKMIEEQGLSKQVEIEMLPEGVRITLGEGVTFATYSAVLIPDAQTILNEIAKAIKSYEFEPLEEVEILGHTDNRPVINRAGKYPSNWELGAARAISVLTYITGRIDIPVKKFEAVTLGKYRPRASNATEEGKRKNRRVEIFVKYGERSGSTDNKETSNPELTQNTTDINNE